MKCPVTITMRRRDKSGRLRSRKAEAVDAPALKARTADQVSED